MAHQSILLLEVGLKVETTQRSTFQLQLILDYFGSSHYLLHLQIQMILQIELPPFTHQRCQRFVISLYTSDMSTVSYLPLHIRYVKGQLSPFTHQRSRRIVISFTHQRCQRLVISLLYYSSTLQLSVGGVMASMLTSNVVDCGFEPRSGQVKPQTIKLIFPASARNIKE